MARFRDLHPVAKVLTLIVALGCSGLITLVVFGPLLWFLNEVGKGM